MGNRWKTAVLVPALCAATTAACETEDAQPRGVEFVQLDREEVAATASLRAQTDAGELARASFVRDHQRARIEIEHDGDRFVAELDPETGEIDVLAEADGATLTWSPTDGTPMPEVLAARWSDVVAAWRDTMLDDEGRLRDEQRNAVNVPAEVFATAIDGLPVSQIVQCPPREECWYDDATGTFVCELLYDVWCPPPPPPCWGSDCEPCGGLWCPPPPPCDTWWCPPPCIGLWCGPCEPWDPFCAQ